MLRRFLHAGRQFANSAADAQRVQIVNSVNLAAIAITLLFQPVNLAVGNIAGMYGGLAAMTLFVLAYRLNAVGRACASALIVCLVAPLTLGAQVWAGGTLAGGELFLIPNALFPFLAFPSAATRRAVMVSLISSLELIAFITMIPAPSTVQLGKAAAFDEIIHTAIATLVCLLGYLAWRLLSISEAGVEREQQRSEAILFDLFPRAVARRLQRGEPIPAERHGDASVLFFRIIEVEDSDPDVQLRVLSGVFAALDDICVRRGVEKIKTFGHSYMAACGVPQARPDHAEALAAAALDMLSFVESLPFLIVVRIGMHSGPVVAGVIGRRRFTYDLWGDVVNTAQRMEAHGIAGTVQVSGVTFSKINHRFRCDSRAPIQIKGKLVERTYLLRGVITSGAPGA